MTTEWKSQRERSTAFMMRVLVRSAFLVGRRVMRWLMWPVAAYFWLTHPAARKASLAYLERVEPQRRAGAARVIRHFHTFANVAVDRLYLLSGRTAGLELRTQYGPGAREQLMSGRGCLLIVAHYGSFESLRVPAVRRRQRSIRIVLDRQVGRMALALFDELDRELAAGIIDASRAGPEVMLNVKHALDAGDIVGIMADRARSDERAAVVDFLGGKVRMPAGPWLIAATLQVPVVLGFGALHGNRLYECSLELFAERVELPRETRETALREVMQRYAHRLEQAVRDAPYNWFNFYDYWMTDEELSSHVRLAARR